MKNKKLELQWPNKDKSLYFDVASGSYEWVNKKDPKVFSKARKAEEWCEIASKATGKKWIYKMIPPHTSVTKIDSLMGIVSSAYKAS